MNRTFGTLRRSALAAVAFAVTVASTLQAQQRVERRIAVAGNVSVKIWIPAGSVRLIGWDRDSLVVEGTIGKGEAFFFGGAGAAAKFGVDEPPAGKPAQPAHLVAYIPRGGRVNVRTVGGSIESIDLSGWFNTVAGDIRLSGATDEVNAEAMDGSIHLDVVSPYARARTGSGALTAAGRVEDLSAATVSGPVTINTQGIVRGRFESVTGPIIVEAPLDRAATIDIDNHNGSVELRLAASLLGDFDLTSVTGSITNRFDKRSAVVSRQGRGQELAFVTSPKGPRIVVRTFKGSIVLRRQ